jgi:hypothetical protein
MKAPAMAELHLPFSHNALAFHDNMMTILHGAAIQLILSAYLCE